ASLAVTLARDANMTLVGFVRQDGYNVYAAGGRLTRSRERNAAAPTNRGAAAPDEPGGGAVGAGGAAAPAADAGADALALIPTSVRRALDDVARKISLVDWEALTLDERRRLVELA